jgi:SAM-dependent methyltransferase
MNFKDYFSTQAEEYAKYRPKYPPELYKYLSSIVSGHNRAWDCATGNGQAAVDLAPYFDEITASDASAAQIEHAAAHPKIKYIVASAENSGLETASCDLITVATAIHWIDTDKFYPEVRRILKPGGVIAVWIYGWSTIDAENDKVFEAYNNIVKDYWPPDTRKAWHFEELIDFPFDLIPSPEFDIKLQWTLKEFLSYLYTWSSTQNYMREKGENPIELIYDDFKKVWGDEESKKTVYWKLKLKAGRV